MDLRKASLIFTVVAGLIVSTAAFASPKCKGDQPKMDQEKVKQIFREKGYDIRKFKVSSDGCYEIYAIQDGHKFEIYIDPWTAAELKKESE